MSDKSLTIRTQAQVVRSMDDVERAAAAMSKSGYFQDAREAAQSVVKILAGQEMGFGPFASMTGIYIIQGRPSIGANLMAAAVKSSGRYNYRVIEMSDTVCEIAFYEQGQECGRSRFTIEDARKAGTKNLDKFPKNMLFARAMSNGCRWFTPDIFAGAPTYTPEELGANVNESGEVIDIIPTITYPTQAERVTTTSDARTDALPHAPSTAAHSAQPANGNNTKVIEWLKQTGLADNDFSAGGMITLFGKDMTNADNKKEFMTWARNYRDWRTAGADSKAAAENAHAGTNPNA